MIPTLRIGKVVFSFSLLTIFVFSGWAMAEDTQNPYRVYSWNLSDEHAVPFLPVQAETDFTPPSSQANPIIPYWRTTAPVSVGYTATDDNAVQDVTLYYRKAILGSQTFGADTPFSTITAIGSVVMGNFTFPASEGQGHYELYTIAQDTSGSIETAPGSADASFGFISNLTKLLPDIKFFNNGSQSGVYGLNNYHFAFVWELATTGRFSNVSIPVSRLVDFNTPYQSIAGMDTVTFVGDSIGAYYSIAKYSSYLLSKFPRVSFHNGTPVENNNFALVNYVNPSLPPSWPSPILRLNDIGDFGKISALINSNQLIINATTTLNAPVDIIVTASSDTATNDWDKELVRVYEVLNNYGLFNSANDTTQWAFENAPGLSNKPTVGYLDTFNNASGILRITFNSSTQGIKMTLGISNWLNSVAGQWYTVRMRVMSDLPNNTFDPNIFIYNGIFPNPFDVADHAILSTPTTWTWLETSIYGDISTKLYPQMVVKNGTNLGNVYIDTIEVIPAKPNIAYIYGIPQINYAGGDWNVADDTTLWAFETPAGSTPASYGVASGSLNISFNGSGTQGVKLTGLSSPGQTATSQIIPGRSSGMKMLFSSSGTLNQPVLILTVFGIDSAGSTKFKELGAAASVLRVPVTGQLETYYLPAQPYLYGQIQVKNNSSAQISLDNTFLQTDSDPDYYWDHSLFE